MDHDQEVIQAMLMAAAAHLTVAAGGNMTTVPIDPNNPVPDQQKLVNLRHWENFRIFYSALIGVEGDPTDWPLPPLPQGVAAAAGLTGPLGTAITAVIKAAPGGATAVLPAVQALLTLLQGQQPPASGSSGAPTGGTTQAGATATPAPVSAKLPVN